MPASGVFFRAAALCALAALVWSSAGAAKQQDPSRVPIIAADDASKLREHYGKRVLVVGVVKSAQWSDTGKVMNIEFEGAAKGLLAVVFQNQRERFDGAWGGDFPRAVTGRRVRLYGEIQEYGGYSEAWKGRPQMILGSPEQVTLPE